MTAAGPVHTDVLAQLLDEIGLGPCTNPARYDVLQRQFAPWWQAGGSVRAFVDLVQAGDQAGRNRPLTGMEARRITERRYRCPG